MSIEPVQTLPDHGNADSDGDGDGDGGDGDGDGDDETNIKTELVLPLQPVQQ